MATARSRTAGTPANDRELRTQGKRTLSKLLDAGLDVMTERGYHAARVDDVVRVAKLSHGTFYLYFANKEDLFRALARECADEMEALAASLGPVSPDKAGEAELRSWLTQFLATYRRYGAVIRGWMEEQVVDRELVRLGLGAFQQIVESLQQQTRPGGRCSPAGSRPRQCGDAWDDRAVCVLHVVARCAVLGRGRRRSTDDDAASRDVRRPGQSTPSNNVEAELNQPPVPFTHAISASGT